MTTNLDETQDAVAAVKKVKRVLIGAWVVVTALMIGSTLISLASIAGMIAHHSVVHEMGQYAMHVGTGMMFVNTALLLAISGRRNRAPAPVQ
jgi:hypothetical protein